MRFLETAVIGVVALASFVNAQTKLAFTSVPTQVVAGQPATVQYASQDLSQVYQVSPMYVLICTDSHSLPP